MKKNKGISLIVLVITIIVIIILATAILVSVISNNPISEANKARYESDRDNMQAVFTNTVGKIMAENQGVVNITAGQINTETSGGNETTGTVAYTVDNAKVEANSSGTIVFDKNTNDATTYYTGKKLPIYAAGETKWYVDSEGVISLEVAGVKYGSGEVEEEKEKELVSLDNWQHQTEKGIIEDHIDEDINGICDICGETEIPGLYQPDGTFISWEQLTNSNIIEEDNCVMEHEIIDKRLLIVEENLLKTSNVHDETLCIECPLYNYLKGHLIIDKNVTEINYNSFGYVAFNLTKITLSNNIKSIPEFYGFNILTIEYNGTTEEWNEIESYCNYSWEYYHGEITVHCTDGEIIIPAS